MPKTLFPNVSRKTRKSLCCKHNLTGGFLNICPQDSHRQALQQEAKNVSQY
jgi:hypothetical protein